MELIAREQSPTVVTLCFVGKRSICCNFSGILIFKKIMGIQQIDLGMKIPSAIVTAEVTTCSRFDPVAKFSEWFFQCNFFFQ